MVDGWRGAVTPEPDGSANLGRQRDGRTRRDAGRGIQRTARGTRVRPWRVSLSSIWLIRLVFLVRIVFFSHNNLTRTIFFSQFQPKFRPANEARTVIGILCTAPSVEGEERT